MEPLPQAIDVLGLPAVIHSRAMREVFERVQRAARSEAAVLVEGESGSGKELVARAVHHYSLRCSRPWVDVSCAALPENLVESELFGHERGAFSGAEAAKQGLFEVAHTGTLFLDEVGELEPRLQVKLLRVLDGAGYYRLGSTRKVFVDVRIVAASNRDLHTASENGQFRNDLYHRLAQINIRVPALRERPDDILPLALFFLRRHNPELRLSAEAVRALTDFPWPGNVRQLRNAMVKTAVFSNQPLVELADLPPEVTGRSSRLEAPPATAGARIDCVERKLILNTLVSTGGHQQRAARLLGISRRTLTRKLKVYRTEETGEARAK